MKLVEVFWQTAVSQLSWFDERQARSEATVRAYLKEYRRLELYVGTSLHHDVPMLLLTSSRPTPFVVRGRLQNVGHNLVDETMQFVGRYPHDKAWEVLDTHLEMMR